MAKPTEGETSPAGQGGPALPAALDIMRYMAAQNPVFQFLRIEILEAVHGRARFAMPVRREVTNTFGNCHGGITFAFADICFGFTANAARNEKGVSSSAEIHWLAPGLVGDRLIGDAREVWHEGRNALYDVTITNEHTGTVVAIVHGRMRFIGGKVMPITP